MKLIFIADTHGNRLNRWRIPDGDALVHLGDFSTGVLSDVRRFAQDMEAQPHRYKIVVAGNHDIPLQAQAREARKAFSNLIYLEDEAVEIDGLKFYGSPWQPDFLDFAFNLPRCGEALESKWRAIPDDTDVLLTHCPPNSILDWVSPIKSVGCELLRYRLDFLKPLVHAFGHVHGARGYIEKEGTLFINAACVYEGVDTPADGPVVVNIDVPARRILDVATMTESVVPKVSEFRAKV